VRHETYIREVPGARTAVLMVHGILGTPAHFAPLYPQIPADWSVYSILLEGHGGKVEDFAAASMAAWQAQVRGWVEKLRRKYARVVFAAHSMGTLFAVHTAVCDPENIAGLFLLNVPLRAGVKPCAVRNALKVALDRASPADPGAWGMRQAYSMAPDGNLLKYLRWIPNYMALLRLMRTVRAEIGRIAVPCRCFQSAHDELIARACTGLLLKNPRICVENLPESGHFAYSCEDQARICAAFSDFCREIGHTNRIKE